MYFKDVFNVVIYSVIIYWIFISLGFVLGVSNIIMIRIDNKFCFYEV